MQKEKIKFSTKRSTNCCVTNNHTNHIPQLVFLPGFEVSLTVVFSVISAVAHSVLEWAELAALGVFVATVK